jgi:hypothetical protein
MRQGVVTRMVATLYPLSKWVTLMILTAVMAVIIMGNAAFAVTQAECQKDPNKQWVTIAVNGQHCLPIGNSLNNNIIFVVLKGILQFLAAGVGLAVAGGIIFGGYMYITARANSGQIEKAKTTIINSIIGLLLFIFMYAILQFLIPGGVFS